VGSNPAADTISHAGRGGSPTRGRGKEKNLLFVNKKKQKNFINFVNCELSQDKHGTNRIKVFCFFFSKKKTLPLHLTDALSVRPV